MTKSWIGSRTNKFGSMLVALGITIVTLPELQDVIDQLPFEYQGYAALVIGIIVMIFRHSTTSPISTNIKASESASMTTKALNHYGFLEAVLMENKILPQEIKSDMEIEDAQLRDIYTVWCAMKQAKELRKG